MINLQSTTIEEELKQYYLHQIKKALDKIFIDKLPINFKWIGFSKKYIPNSKIIHIYRKEEATCFGAKTTASAGGNYFSFDLKNIVEMYNLYLDYTILEIKKLKDFYLILTTKKL